MKIRHMLTAAAIVITGAAGWGVWNRWFTERADPSAEIYTVRGIDISAHNGNVDFHALRRQGVTFAYIKATEGTDFIDRRFVDNARGLLAGNIPAGAYHFFRFDTDGEMQAWNFIRAIEGRGFRLPPAVDLEEWGNDETIPTARVRTSLRAFMRVLSEEGYHPVIYTNKDGYNRFVRHHSTNIPSGYAPSATLLCQPTPRPTLSAGIYGSSPTGVPSTASTAMWTSTPSTPRRHCSKQLIAKRYNFYQLSNWSKLF